MYPPTDKVIISTVYDTITCVDGLYVKYSTCKIHCMYNYCTCIIMYVYTYTCGGVANDIQWSNYVRSAVFQHINGIGTLPPHDIVHMYPPPLHCMSMTLYICIYKIQ